MICTKLLQTAMNGLSKSASDEITPVARRRLRCGARIMPFLIVSLMAMANAPQNGSRLESDYSGAAPDAERQRLEVLSCRVGAAAVSWCTLVQNAEAPTGPRTPRSPR